MEGGKSESPLSININTFTQRGGTTYYIITVTKAYNQSEKLQIEKRYSQFHTLNETLKNKNYKDLPKFPAKTFMPMRSSDHLDRRRQELNQYIKEIVNRRDTLNAKDVIKFLELDKFAPEVLIRKPKVVEMLELSGQMYFYVSSCIFLPNHNVFVLCLNDKYRRNSKLEVYSFRQTGVVRDSYVMKGGSFFFPEAPIFRTFSFSGCLGQKTVDQPG